MSYSSFTNEKIKDKFGVEQTLKRGIFDNLPKRTPSNWLLETLSKTRDFALSQGSEKARSEYIIAPVFYELREQSEQQISIFSGRKFDIDKKQQLDGFCDFLVSRSPSQVILESPVMVAVEAKQDKFENAMYRRNDCCQNFQRTKRQSAKTDLRLRNHRRRLVIFGIR
jgi:hypothetical protein